MIVTCLARRAEDLGKAASFKKHCFQSEKTDHKTVRFLCSISHKKNGEKEIFIALSYYLHLTQFFLHCTTDPVSDSCGETGAIR